MSERAIIDLTPRARRSSNVIGRSVRGRHGAGLVEITVIRWSDRELVDRILAGQQEAVADLVDAHHAAIYRFLHRLCMDAHWAEDLAQETFAAAWNRLRSFNGDASLATWLHRIAYCKFIDAWRRQRRRAPLEGGAGIEAVTDPRSNPGEVAAADEESRRIHAALALLDRADREIIALHYFQGFTFREMARVLDIKVGLAKWRTNRALTRLRRLLGET